jgi:5S rRNA maturation endonuclease (ribonuclease M5)
MTTLAEALADGRGNERPFRCHEHDDSSASASVNVAKGVWFCFTCHAKGTVDGKKEPTTGDLLAMMEPEKAARVIPLRALEMYEPGSRRIYWHTRFPDWLVWQALLGEDPFTGDGTFPVWTPKGQLAGVGRRRVQPPTDPVTGKVIGPRYKYPPRWSAARVLHGTGFVKGPQEIIVLVEGMADAVSLWELGVPAFAVYGSGLHAPQLEQIHRMGTKVVITGFDMDEAGSRATDRTKELLSLTIDKIETIIWPEKDPGDCSVEQREAAVGSVVPTRYLQRWKTDAVSMHVAYDIHNESESA